MVPQIILVFLPFRPAAILFFSTLKCYSCSVWSFNNCIQWKGKFCTCLLHLYWTGAIFSLVNTFQDSVKSSLNFSNFFFTFYEVYWGHLDWLHLEWNNLEGWNLTWWHTWNSTPIWLNNVEYFLWKIVSSVPQPPRLPSFIQAYFPSICWSLQKWTLGRGNFTGSNPKIILLFFFTFKE